MTKTQSDYSADLKAINVSLQSLLACKLFELEVVHGDTEALGRLRTWIDSLEEEEAADGGDAAARDSVYATVVRYLPKRHRTVVGIAKAARVSTSRACAAVKWFMAAGKLERGELGYQPVGYSSPDDEPYESEFRRSLRLERERSGS